MNLRVRSIDDPAEATRLAPFLALALAASREALEGARGEEPAEELARGFVRRAFGKPETLVLLAEGAGGPVGLLVTGPLVDPVSGASAPLVTALYVVPEYRQRGIARALFAEGKRFLLQRGVRRLLARAAHNDDVLISMGERWGLVRAWELMAFEG